MQTTLLGIGIALILAILAAFAAPLYMDWNSWRPQFEAQASALAHTRVAIRGPIEITLLPTPAFVLREVALGDPDQGTGLRAREVRGSLALTALLAGRIEASGIEIAQPAIRFALDAGGNLVLPPPVAGGDMGAISIAQFTAEGGSLLIEDRRTNAMLRASDVTFRGELVAREGPFRIEAALRHDGQLWSARINASRFGPDHAGKIRFALERPADGLTLEADGTLNLGDAAPRFSGKLRAARRAGALPWQFLADANGDAAEIALANIELSLGDPANPMLLGGTAKFAPHAGGAFEAAFTATRLDFDRGDAKAAANGAAQALPVLWLLRDGLAALPFDGRVTLAADGVIAGGQLSRNLRAGVRTSRGAIFLDSLEARLPARSAIRLTRSGERFSLQVDSEEPAALARWLIGPERAGPVPADRALRLRAEIGYTEDRVSIAGLDLSLGEVRVTGSGDWQRRGERWAAALKLGADKVALENLWTLLAPLQTEDPGFDLALDFEARGALLFDTAMKRFTLRAETAARALSIRQFALEDFDGLTVRGKREADGRISFEGEAASAGGLALLTERFFESAEAGTLLRRVAAPYMPLPLAGSFGNLSESGSRTFALTAGSLSAEGSIGEFKDGARAIAATLRIADTRLTATGELRVDKAGLVQPVFDLALAAPDLRSAIPALARAASAALPARGAAQLRRTGQDFSFEGLALELAGVRLIGRLQVRVNDFTEIDGAIAAERLRAAAFLSLLLGRSNDASPWPDAIFGPALLTTLRGKVALRVTQLGLSEGLDARNVRGVLAFAPTGLTLDGIAGEFAGGRFTANALLGTATSRAVQVRLTFDDLGLSALLATKTVRGRIDGTLALAGDGTSAAAIVASAAGQGRLVVKKFELDGADPAAPARVFAAPLPAQADEAAVQKRLQAALARAPMRIERLEAPVLISGGVARINASRVKVGSAEVTAGGLLRLAPRSFEAVFTIEQLGTGAARPGATLRWEGPFAQPERSLDARALFTAISLKALERSAPPAPEVAPLLPVPPLAAPVAPNPPPLQRPVEVDIPSIPPSAVPPLPPPIFIQPAPQPRRAPAPRPPVAN